MKTIYEELERVSPLLDEGGNYLDDQVNFDVNLRLDFEIPYDRYFDDEVKSMMFFMVGSDIEDLLINGDISKADDYLLKALDGSIKRNQELEDVTIRQITTQWAYKEGKDTTEFAMYINISTKWN